MFSAHTIIEARGGKTVSEAIIQPLTGGSEHSFECDLVVVSGGTIPATSLLLQAGAKSAYDAQRGHFALSEMPSGVFAAGEVAGADSDPTVAASGELAGLEAAHALGLGDDASAKRVTALTSAAGRAGRARRRRGPARERRGARQVLCLLLRGRHQQGRPPLHRGGL